MPNHTLGQHWLKDRLTLEAIADVAEVSSDDTVLEIGPGLGTLTSVLLSRAERVVAVEYDEDLARKLPGQFPGKQLEVINTDILTFDLRTLPIAYKVVANVPYYITQKIIEKFLGAEQKPETIILLVQQEVAEKLAAHPGDMTLIAVKAQNSYDIQLGARVHKSMFEPAPKVDSRVVIMKKRPTSTIPAEDETRCMQLISAGFSQPRKKLRSSLAAGLRLTPDVVDALLVKSDIDLSARPQDLSVEQWKALIKQ